MRALILALALAACGQTTNSEQAAPPAAEPPAASEPASAAAAWEDARAQGVDFRAIGQEPGWVLNIYRQERITLAWDYGQNSATFPLTEPTYPVEGQTRYDASADGKTIAVVIRRFPCQDAMSGAAFPATVEVTIDGRTLQGCGKSV